MQFHTWGLVSLLTLLVLWVFVSSTELNMNKEEKGDKEEPSKGQGEEKEGNDKGLDLLLPKDDSEISAVPMDSNISLSG